MTRPFQKQGVSKYPLQNPMVGQKEIFYLLDGFKNESLDEEDSTSNFFVVIGDWGQGKSRLGHEIAAEILETSKGWYFKEEEDPLYTERYVFRKDDGFLPIFIQMKDVIERKKIDRETIIIECVIKGFSQLIDEDRNEINKETYKKLVEIDRSIPNQIELTLSDNSLTDRDKNKKLFQILKDKSGGRIKRIMIIIDEIELLAEIISTPEEEERGIERDDINVLANAIKEEVNEMSIPIENVSFVLLCSLGAGNLIKFVQPNERRLKYAQLSQLFYGDLIEYIRILRETGIPNLDFEDYVIKYAYISADRNFGWFSYLMNQIYLLHSNYKEDGVEIEPLYLIKEGLKHVGRLFDMKVIEYIKNYRTRPQIPNFEEYLFNLIPVRMDEVDSDIIPKLLDYVDPFGYKEFAILVPVNLTSGDLIEALRKNEFEIGKSDEREIIYKKGANTINPADFLEGIKIFQINGDQYLIYKNIEEFKDLIYHFTGQQFDERTIKILHEIFMKHAIDEEYIGLTIKFISTVNKRWNLVESSKRWLKEPKWDEIIKKYNSLSGNETTERICKGIAYIFMNIIKNKSISEAPDEIGNLRSAYYIVKVERDSLFNLSKSNQIFFYHFSDFEQTKTDLQNYYTKKSNAPTFLIFNSESSKDNNLKKILSINNVFFKKNVIDLVISSEEDRRFFIYFSFFNDLFDDGHIIDRSMIKNKEKQLLERFNTWLSELDERGLLVKPILKERGRNVKLDFLLGACNEFLKMGEEFTIDSLEEEKIILVQSDRETYIKFFNSYLGESRKDFLDIFEPIDFSDKSQLLKFRLNKIYQKILSELRNPATTTSISAKFFYQANNYSGNLSNIEVAFVQILQFLKELNLVFSDDTGSWHRISKYQLIEKYKDAINWLDGILSEERDDSIQSFEKYFGSNILSKLNMTVNELRQLQGDLGREKDQIESIAEDILYKGDEQNVFSSLICEINKRLNRIKEINVNFEQEDAFEDLSAAEIDEILIRYKKRFSIETPLIDRINFLTSLKKNIEDSINENKEKIEEILRDIAANYSEYKGIKFPITSIKEPLEKIKKDLNFAEKIEDIEDIRGELSEIPLKGLLGASKIKELVEILENYSDIIDEKWRLFKNAFSNFKKFIDNWPELEVNFNSITAYLQGATTYKADLDKITLSYNELKNYKENISEFPGADNLKDFDKALVEIVKSETALIKEIKELYEKAQKDIKDRISNNTNLKYLQKLEKRKDGRISTTDSCVFEATNYITQSQRINKLKNTVETRGKELLGDDKYWQLYIRISKLKDQGLTDNQIFDEIGDPAIIKKLDELGAISYTPETTHHMTL